MHHNGRTAELLESGRKAGVVKYVIFSTATTPHQVEAINDYIISECALHPEFIGTGTMHTEYADFEKEIDRIYRAGVRGIKVHPDFQQFNFDDERLMPVYALLEKNNMFVITHSGDYRYDFSHPARVARVAELFPRLRIVAAHFGGWMTWELGRRYLVKPNVYVDTSSTIGFGGVQPVYEGLKAFDPTHIFFGCDFPMWDHQEEVGRLLSLGLNDKLLEDIFYNNFAAFYGLQ
jgi:predicted TIM-barrel fold metal-dependent hydrolase